MLTRRILIAGLGNQHVYLAGAVSGTLWRLKVPNPGLIGPGGVRLPAQP